MKLASVIALAGLLVFAGSARAQLSGSVRLSADTTDAPVESIATNGARTLVAGRDLSRVQHATRGGAIVSAVSGQPLALVQDVEDVHRVIPAPDGGWYVAAQDKVMRLRADGSVDAAFGVVLGDGESPGDVRSLALSPDGSTLWLGGFFDTVNGTTRRVLAAVDSSTGALRPWQAGSVFEPFELAVHGNVVYAGGMAWDGSRERTFVALDATTGAPLGYGPERFMSSVALAPDGRTLYVGIEGDGLSNALAAVDTATLTERWRVATGGEPLGLALNGGRLYFTNAGHVGGVERPGVAAVDAATGALLPLSVPQGAGQVLVPPNGATLYTGAYLPVPWSLTGAAIAASTSDGALLGWAPRSSYPAAISLDGQRLFMKSAGNHPRNGVAMLDETGTVVPWSDPYDVPWSQYVTDTALDVAGRAFIVRSNRTVYAVAPDGTPQWQHKADAAFSVTLSPDERTLYLHGSFTQVDGVARSRVAAVRVSDGALLPWAPVVSGGWVSTVAVHGSAVYLGGSFTSPGKNLAAVDAVTGAALPFTAFVDGTVYHLAVAPAGDTLYLGGQFEHVAGTAIENLAGVSTADGRLVFRPALNTNVQDLALVQGGRTLVVGSTFYYEDRHLSAWDTSTSAEVPWALGDCYRCTISALAVDPDGTTLHVGGEFRYGSVYAYYGTVAIDRPEVGTPANRVPPSLWAFAVRAGEWVECDPGAWSGHPTEYRFAWRVDGAVVPGYDARDFLLDATDVGKTVACEVRAVGTTTSAPATSAAIPVAAGTSLLVPAPRRDPAPPPGGPTPTPTPTATATATASPTVTASPTASPTPTPTTTATPTPTTSPTATPTATPAATASPTATPAATASPTATPAATTSPTPTGTPSGTPTPTPSPTATPIPTADPTVAPGPLVAASPRTRTDPPDLSGRRKPTLTAVRSASAPARLTLAARATVTASLRSSTRTTRRTFTLAAGRHSLTARRLTGRARLAKGRYTLTVRAAGTTRVVRFRV